MDKKVLSKAMKFCAYQERSHMEVRSKLYSFGLYKNEVEEIIAELIQENFLNEERFARSFSRGKFNLKNWGRIKIKYELKQRGVSNGNILAGLDEINELEYEKRLVKLLHKKFNSLKQGRLFEKKFKTKKYLIQKGFEPSLIQRIMEEKLQDKE